ncbi:lipid-binding SYLF domain-containing protein [Paraferrimonas haliotis]|uniref:Ysc84 actin-binding domain-containing protein n=1 Tax=Paraferrimonas haliotis TaxID=2013866 RepID=A0AA37WXY0_9GAMM|nr:lipid-binding SYLF domain-containing protein [Paraferrimonas haliotis]GLS83120.1 hypothetical protein GCM10007894_10970 [Paraferrimonas haliotis]
MQCRHQLFGWLLAAVFMCSGCASSSIQSADTKQALSGNDAHQLTQLSLQNLQTFMTQEHWSSVKNLSGSAKAIVIIPSGRQAGFIVGGQWGRGILLVRHHQDWSDPIFIKLNSVQVGLLAGAQQVNGIGAILSNQALERVFEGKYRFGAAGDTTLGPGFSGKAAGSTHGIEVLMVSSNQGAYLGGSFEGLKLSLDMEYNRQAYGDDFSVKAVLANRKGGNYPAAAHIQQQLSQAAYESVYGD